MFPVSERQRFPIGCKMMHFIEVQSRSQPFLLKRAPTLHRTGIQAFEPVLADGTQAQP